MSFFKRLQRETEQQRAQLLTSPLVTDALAQRMSREHYVAFLMQAYHHVRHTTPLLMAAGSRMPADKEWLREALAEYIEEELGHQEWVLNDIAACGFDAERVRDSIPNRATELMVAYAYHIIDRVNPLGFFGMVHVLEGTSVQVADRAADCIAAATGLGTQAFSYLRSHGALDIEHIAFFEKLMNRIDDDSDQQQIIHCCKNFYLLYRGVYDSIEPKQSLRYRAEESLCV